jgi:carbon-monoxide dehydrogenase large subunit
MFGEKIVRVEDDRLLRGNGQYTDDLGADALAIAMVRSPHAHARVVDIDVDGVLDVDGVVAVYTHDDLTGAMAAPLPLLIPHPTLTHGRTQYALAKDEVNYVGEAVAMVVAVDRYVAEDAAGRIAVTYEPLPAVVGIEAARRADLLVHDDVPGNVAARMVQEAGDAQAAIAAAPHRLSLDLQIERSASMPMEGRERWPAGTASRTACACGRPRRPRPVCGPPSQPGSGSTSCRSTSSPPTWAAASASRSCTRGRRSCWCRWPHDCSSGR